MITAVVPMKPLSAAKRRLSRLLDDGARQRLAALMLGDVLECLVQSSAVHEVLVVSADESLEEIAVNHGARLLREPSPHGLDSAVSFAASALATQRSRSMLFVPGDVPLVTGDEITSITEAARDAAIVIVPSHDRDGTNAMYLSPPGIICPAFGPGSFDRHVAAARQGGVLTKVLELPCLSRDIDNGADLLRLAAARAGDSRYGFLVDRVKALAGEAV